MNKSKITISTIQKNPSLNVITKDNKHLLSKEMQSAYEHITANPIVFPKRYLRAQKNNLKRKIHELYEKQPDLPAKLMLARLLDPLPDFIPTEMLQELCVHILQCWREEMKLVKS
ncbi:MAG: hypothetical protein AB8G86_07535 [Saprospiraceae bacterium]